MKLVFIGTGSAFSVGGNYHSNMYFENDQKKRFLFDCGSDIRHALYDLQMTHSDIDAIYISHLHADHVGGLEWIAFQTYFDPKNKRKLPLYIEEELGIELWENVLKGGLSSLENLQTTLSTFFEVHSFPKNGSFTWEGIQFKSFPLKHVISNHKECICNGLKAEIDGKNILISADTQFPQPNDILYKEYEKADIIFHDCETMPFKTNVHPHYTDLITLDPKIKSKMWLYHYQKGDLPDAKKDGFRGFVKKGQCFDFQNPSTY